MRHPLRPGDIIILLLALGAVGWSYVHFWQGQAATRAQIWAQGEIRHELPLVEHRRLEVAGPLGESIIEIAPGRARFVSSPCQRQRCVHTGWIDAAGTVAACLPNRVSLHIKGRGQSYDAVNF